jgi:hypothetical protein
VGIDPRVTDLLDNSIRDELQRWGDSLFLAVLISALLVVVGVALEGPEVLHEIWPKLFTCFTGGSFFRIRKFKRTIKILGLVGWLLVVVGVAGEGVFEGLQNRAESQLRTFNDTLLREARLTAGTAKQSAIDAGDAAGRAQTAANTAESTSNAVGKEADDLSRQLTDLKSQVALVEEQRKKLEEDLTNLAVCSAPRVITNWWANGKTYVDPLRPFKGFEAIIVFLPDPETRRAASSLASALNDAGWIVKPGRPHLNENILDGVLIESYGPPNMLGSPMQFEATEKSRSAALDLVKFLHSHNWQTRWIEGHSAETDLVPNSVRIVVGLYPPNEFVLPPAEQEVAAAIAESQKKLKAYEQTESLQRLNERLKSLSATEASRARSEWESRQRDREAENKSSLEEYGIIQPCRPLNALVPEP